MLADILSSAWAQERYQMVIQDDVEFESFQFGQLLLGFGEAKVESLMRSDDEQSRGLLLSMCELLSARGYPAVEDKVFIPALEFWSTSANGIRATE
ncbi:member of the karyopherin-beta [Amphichorda felina]